MLITTYNHERYIAQAIDGVLAQEVDFRYEIVIGEDCSTDGTRRIVREYQRRHPSLIRLVLPARNEGAESNRFFARVLRACRGTYVAVLDGDDYWISADKLRKQAEFLDGHPEYSSCFHNTRFQFDGIPAPVGHPETITPAGRKATLTTEDLLAPDGLGSIQTSTTMFRPGLFGEFPDWYWDLTIGDWALSLLNSRWGPIGYIDSVMGVYRLHAQGLWTGLSGPRRLGAIVAFYETMTRGFPAYATRIDPLLNHYRSLAAQVNEARGPEPA